MFGLPSDVSCWYNGELDSLKPLSVDIKYFHCVCSYTLHGYKLLTSALSKESQTSLAGCCFKCHYILVRIVDDAAVANKVSIAFDFLCFLSL